MTAPTHDGLVAGRYQLVAPIGSGGAGTVYRGLDILLNREIAVKQLALAPAADDGPPAEAQAAEAEAAERTVREARAAARIQHPGVAAIYDVVSGGDSPYIVMQLVEGRPLAELIADQGPLPPYRVADIGRQVLAALVAGHLVGVPHRDLKPANVMITPDGQAVLTDFGIVVTAGGPSGYLAPERAMGMPATPAADLWSLGATLYAALCGQGPVAGEDPPHLSGNGSLYDIVNALLRRAPADRPTFHEIARALDVAAADAPSPAPSAAPSPAPSAAPGMAASPLAEAAPRLAEAAPSAAEAPPAAEAAPPAPGIRQEPDAIARPVPAVPAASAGPGKRRANQADRLGRASLVLAAIAGLAIVASAVAAFVPGSNHAASAPPGPAGSSPTSAPSSAPSSPAPSAPGLAGPPAPPPIGQQFRVAAAANADASPEVVAVAGNGRLIASRFGHGSWSAWTTLPGGPAYTADPAVVTAKDGRLIVFARAKTGQVAEIWQTSPGAASWQGPVALGTTITHSSPAVVAWPDGHLEVFALLSDAHVGYVSQSSGSGGGTWTGWTSLGGPVTGPPAVALDATGHPQVFAATVGRQLVHDYYLSGNWAGWAPAPGNSRFVGVPGVAANADGRLEVFARSTNGDLLHIWQLSRTGTRWGGPAQLAGNACSTDPAVLSGTDGEHGGRLEAFCMDSNFGLSVFHTVQLSAKAGASWSPWQSLKGSSNGAVTALQTPTVTEILARTASGAFAYATWTAQHTWSPWAPLPPPP